MLNHAFWRAVAKTEAVISSGVFCRELIGRSSELAFLLDCVRAAPRDGSVAVVVRGDAGIGKTRLLDEVARAARAEGFRTAIGSTREFANAPYAALEEALGLLDIDAVRSADEDAPDAKARRFDAVASAVAVAADAAQHGLLVITEDLHWADVATLELLRFLATRLSAHRVTFIATYRHDELDADSARARLIASPEREARATVLLDALPPRSIERLLASTIRDRERNVPADVVDQIRDLSDGRPLFAEELLRGVFERLDRDAHAEPSVPTSIRVTVHERFAALIDADRTVLLHAAVIGRRFSARFLASFLGGEQLEVYAALRRARDLQLIVEQPDDDGGDAFTFRHALTREAVYDELLRAEARLMHAKVATVLAAERAPDVAAIAEHLARAGDAPAAAQWSERAGDEAFAVYAYTDAARAYERAHRLMPGNERSAPLAERAAESWYALGDLEQAGEWFGHAAAARHAAQQRGLGWQLELRKARVLFESGRYDAGFREVEQLARTPDADPAARFEAETMAAGLLAVRLLAVEALEHLERAEALEIVPETRVAARFAGTYALALGHLGRTREATLRFEAAVAAAQSIGDHDLVMRTYNNWANHEIAYGTLARAGDLYDAALRVAEARKNQRVAAWIAPNVVLQLMLGGDLAGARELLARSSRIEHGVAAARRWSLALSIRLGLLQGTPQRGELEPAQLALAEAIDDADLSSIAVLSAAVAHVLAADHQIAPAGAVLERVMPLFDRVEAPYWFCDAASRFGGAAVRARARECVEPVAAHDGAYAAKGVLALFDAREALRRRRREASVAHAEAAVAHFRRACWRVEEGYALELAGRVAEAVALFRQLGAAAEVRRNTETTAPATRRRGESTLTGREREIAGLVVAGSSTRAIAETLIISERTVETHIAAVYRKLGVSNRRALEALLAESAPT